ncbi:uncharacterized protein G2W53_003753 [Senna tora]|uniref:Uncharacterized protein n=1 Tax=Senna tora TaxID=362788 RepID=A0A835CIP9_9FABA|nr:uncharacterized protein G2W53_003753 [Senna tora]
MEEDLDDLEEENIEDEKDEDPLNPIILTTKEERKESAKPWQNFLIIKLMAKGKGIVTEDGNVQPVVEKQQIVNTTTAGEYAYGPWMLVQKNNRRMLAQWEIQPEPKNKNKAPASVPKTATNLGNQQKAKSVEQKAGIKGEKEKQNFAKKEPRQGSYDHTPISTVKVVENQPKVTPKVVQGTTGSRFDVLTNSTAMNEIELAPILIREEKSKDLNVLKQKKTEGINGLKAGPSFEATRPIFKPIEVQSSLPNGISTDEASSSVGPISSLPLNMSMDPFEQRAKVDLNKNPHDMKDTLQAMKIMEKQLAAGDNWLMALGATRVYTKNLGRVVQPSPNEFKIL